MAHCDVPGLNVVHPTQHHLARKLFGHVADGVPCEQQVHNIVARSVRTTHGEAKQKLHAAVEVGQCVKGHGIGRGVF